ncbi:MAG TPA: carboxypeptidase-like regulatory domain-containing protein [Minicystis sp.]|nr:carboxypeptidase-like regulatory domain-containing protein [Minicystis sp.]
MPTPTALARDDAPLPRLTRLQFWSIFGVALAIFLFATGPVWRHVWSIGVLNDAILWSYVPIPLMVTGALAYKRRLTLRAFFLDTLELTLLKYTVTFGLALVLWSIHEPPPVVFDYHAPRPLLAASPPPPPTPIDPARAGAVTGIVSDASGRAVEGALVYVAAGLEGVVFAPPKQVVTVQNDGASIRPSLAGAVLGQPIEARSSDGRMHTLVATAGGATIFNVPLLPAGTPRPVEVKEAHGPMELRCTVHPNERHAVLAVLSHPFFALTGADGRYRFAGVPEGRVRVAVTRDGKAVDASRDVLVEGRRDVDGALRIDAR